MNNIMLIATVSVAVTNIMLVVLYLISIKASNAIQKDLINRLMSKNYGEYANVELAKDREETKRKDNKKKTDTPKMIRV